MFHPIARQYLIFAICYGFFLHANASPIEENDKVEQKVANMEITETMRHPVLDQKYFTSLENELLEQMDPEYQDMIYVSWPRIGSVLKSEPLGAHQRLKLRIFTLKWVLLCNHDFVPDDEALNSHNEDAKTWDEIETGLKIHGIANPFRQTVIPNLPQPCGTEQVTEL